MAIATRASCDLPLVSDGEACCAYRTLYSDSLGCRPVALRYRVL